MRRKERSRPSKWDYFYCDNLARHVNHPVPWKGRAAHIFWSRFLSAYIFWPLFLYQYISWPGPMDGILSQVPMADILSVILRSLDKVLEIMGVYRNRDLVYRRIDDINGGFAAHFRKSYVDRASQGHGQRIRDGHHRSMARLLQEIRESDYKCREALYDPRLHLEFFTHDLPFHWDFELFVHNPQHYRMLLRNMPNRVQLKLLGSRRIRRRNKQRHRRALFRFLLAEDNLESCIRELIREAMLYHLICSIEKEQGRSFEFPVVCREIDVRVIEVVISLFSGGIYLVTSYIDLVGRFRHYHVDTRNQDGDGPWQYKLRRIIT